MAHTSTASFSPRPFAGLRARLSEAVAATAARRAQHRDYRRVREELMALSARDLADIGIGRDQIDTIARDHAYGA
ncbi:uncharacterized protein DUF1127 [Palleronia aestuarii]|uniref:Uncharacterized protein DUF1127 n=1 Tax=Palleronia aestuarii TaxID=568105 RepID=A0A2W7MYA6_9RHOB|nr:DUF1127 domain-containing protein [Palleronia aestuarii]PZX13085.1 uncharacterized protein DUF1127 [Palleronia aestuarii]